MKRGDMEAAACMLERAWEVSTPQPWRRPPPRCPESGGVREVTGTVQQPVDSKAKGAVQAVRGITMNNRATLCRENGDLDGAREALQRSLHITRTPQVPNPNPNPYPYPNPNPNPPHHEDPPGGCLDGLLGGAGHLCAGAPAPMRM
jgi:hypothetical protein